MAKGMSDIMLMFDDGMSDSEQISIQPDSKSVKKSHAKAKRSSHVYDLEGN